jgi:hypothetical protein
VGFRRKLANFKFPVIGLRSSVLQARSSFNRLRM